MSTQFCAITVALCAFLSFVNTSGSAQAQKTSAGEMQMLAPDTQDIQGFVKARPLAGSILPEVPITDEVVLGTLIAGRPYVPYNAPPRHAGVFSRISRGFYSSDGIYTIGLTIKLYDSVITAHEAIQSDIWGAQMSWKQGSLSGTEQIGEESWVPSGAPQEILCRAGRVVVLVHGDLSPAAKQQADSNQDFPSAAVEALAYQILLRVSQQPELTGVSVQQASLGVNGHILPKNALRVAGQTYVPVAEFAKAMGLTSHWDTKTGELTLSGARRKTVELTAGSTATKKGTGAGTALTVPVLKQSGQPVMTLTDLLTVTGGRIVGHSGNAVQIKG